MPREMKRDRRIRGAGAEQKRLRRAQLTEEELREARAVEAKRVRQKRAQMTEEELEIRRARDAAKKRERRSALKSEEELEQIRAREKRSALKSDMMKQRRAVAAERVRQKRAQMTPEELQKRRARDAATKREKRSVKKSEEELQQIRAKDNERNRRKREKMTEEEVEKAKADHVEYERRKKAEMTEEERKKRNARHVEYHRLQKARMTEEEKEEMKRKIAERRRIKENGTTVERIRSMISVAGEFAHRHPARYEIPGTFIKNALNDILTMHTTVEKLRRTLKQTVADAVKNAVSLHQIEKQTKTAGYLSHTFVEVSALPLFSKHTTKKEFTQSENEPDPLLDQPDVQTDKLSCSKENPTVDKTDETFKVCNYVDAPENFFSTVTSKKFECSTCSKKFETSLGLMIHEKEHSADLNEFKCSICSQIFNSYNSMTIHYLQVHSFEIDVDPIAETEELDDVLERHCNEFEFLFARKCLICFTKFDLERVRLTTYLNHLIEDHSENEELLKHVTYSCARCDKHFAVLRSLETHWKSVCFKKWKSESDENRRGIVCEKCGMRFSNEKSLASHSDIYHVEKNKVFCEHCGKEFKDDKLLKLHVRAVHETRQAFICEQCGNSFKSRNNLMKHTKIVHLGEKRFTCSLCDQRFENNSKLDIHMNTHTGEKPFQCKYCDKNYASMSGLYYHERKHERGVCKSTETGENRSRKHHVSKGLKYTCEICGKIFKNICTLKDHKFSHDAQPRFGCSLCEKTFRTKNYYYQHKLQKHPKEKGHVVKLIPDAETPSNIFDSNDPTKSNRFGCSLCGQTFQDENNFYRHKVQKHKASENAQMVKLTSEEDAFANLLPIRDASATFYNAPEMGTPTASNMSLEPQYSPRQEDYSPEMEYDNEIISEDETPLPQFEVGELTNVQCAIINETSSQQNNISPLGSNKAEYSNSLQNSVFDTITEDLHQSVPISTSFIDFSRANVPSVVSTLTEEASNIKVEESKNLANQKTSRRRNEQKHTVFVEDPGEQDSFVADVDLNDLVKIKMETVVDVYNESTNVSYENEASIFVRPKNSSVLNSSNKNPIVKLTRLLEHHCVPCDKTIFAVSQREIRKHRRTHLKNESIKKRPKYEFTSGNGKLMMNSFDCLYCEMKNVSGRKIVAHCKIAHPGLKPLRCKQCPWMSNTFDTYYNHKKKHNAPKPKVPRDPNATKDILCEVCGKAFYTKPAMCSHRSMMHRGEVSVECDICHKVVQGKYYLKLHKERHMGIKPHLCEECGSRFCSKSELQAHVRVVHRGEKKRPRTNKSHRFACTLCPYRFIQEIGLKQHMPMHDPKRKFVCEQCGLRFTTKGICETHVKIIHNKIKLIRKPKKQKAPPADVEINSGEI